MARAIPETPRALIRWAKEGASKIASGDDEGGDAQQGEEQNSRRAQLRGTLIGIRANSLFDPRVTRTDDSPPKMIKMYPASKKDNNTKY